MVKYEKKVPSLAKYALKREIKIRFGSKDPNNPSCLSAGGG